MFVWKKKMLDQAIAADTLFGLLPYYLGTPTDYGQMRMDDPLMS